MWSMYSLKMSNKQANAFSENLEVLDVPVVQGFCARHLWCRDSQCQDAAATYTPQPSGPVLTGNITHRLTTQQTRF